MHLWACHIDTIGSLPMLARVVVVASETRCDTSYRLEGRARGRETHCLFKYTLSGAGVFRDAAGEHRVPVGTGFLCQINDPATAYYYPVSGREPWTFLYVCLEGESTRLVVADMIKRYGPVYHLSRNDGIIAELQEFGHLRAARLSLSASESGRLATGVLLSLVKVAEAAGAGNVEGQFVRKALELVDQRLERRLAVSDLADTLRVSREHFTRVFAAQMGMSPYQYILRRKIRHACYLLKEGRLTNKEVAARLGFTDPAHFTRAFKSLMRMAPRDFRQHGTMPTW